MPERKSADPEERGQAVVEAALSIPLTTFLILSIIQLGMMHQAQIMNQLAAYRAARAGVVNSGSCDLMLNSAMSALIPTFGPTPSVGGFPSISGRVDSALKQFEVWSVYKGLNSLTTGLFKFPLVTVEVLNPKKSALNGLFTTYGQHLSNREIDFDDVRDATVVDANLLSVRVKYWYRLRIPFADWQIHTMWVGQQILKYFRGIQFENQSAFGIGARTASRLNGLKQGGDLAVSSAVATAFRLYYVPIVSVYTMRMQSNLMLSQVSPCAVDN